MGRRHRDPTGGHQLLRDMLDYGAGDIPRSVVGPLVGERDRLARRVTELETAGTRTDRADKDALAARARRAEVRLENADTVWRGRYEHLSGVFTRTWRAMDTNKHRADLAEARAARAERLAKNWGLSLEPDLVALYDTTAPEDGDGSDQHLHCAEDEAPR